MKKRIVQNICTAAALIWPALPAIVSSAMADARSYAVLYSDPDPLSRQTALVSEDAPFTIYGCIADGSWCDVGYNNHRGWVHGYIIQAGRANNIGYTIEPGPYVPHSYVNPDYVTKTLD